MNITDNGTFPTTAQTGTTDAFYRIFPGKRYLVEIIGSAFDSGSIAVQLYRGGAWDVLATKNGITEAEGFEFISSGSRIRFVVTSVAGASADIDIHVTQI